MICDFYQFDEENEKVYVNRKKDERDSFTYHYATVAETLATSSWAFSTENCGDLGSAYSLVVKEEGF